MIGLLNFVKLRVSLTRHTVKTYLPITQIYFSKAETIFLQLRGYKNHCGIASIYNSEVYWLHYC